MVQTWTHKSAFPLKKKLKVISNTLKRKNKQNIKTSNSALYIIHWCNNKSSIFGGYIADSIINFLLKVLQSGFNFITLNHVEIFVSGTKQKSKSTNDHIQKIH